MFATWIGIGIWGFFANGKIDREMRLAFGDKGELIGFVFARPSPLLDLHAEIGLLTLAENELRIIGEHEPVVIACSDVELVGRRFNLHSILVHRGWIVLKLSCGSELKLESRKYPTMFRSSSRTNELFRELQTWKHEKAPA